LGQLFKRIKWKTLIKGGVMFIKKTVCIALVIALALSFTSCPQPAGGNFSDESLKINSQPLGGGWDVSTANTFNLSVSATGEGSLSCQWYTNVSNANTGGAMLFGETSMTLSLAKADYGRNGTRYFYAEVSNTDGKVTSNAATVAVSGNSADPVMISSAEELRNIGSGVYKLANDITLANWTPIGDEAKPFKGVLDGNGKTITLQSFDNAALFSKAYLGIFGNTRGDTSDLKVSVINLKIDSAIDVTSNPSNLPAIGQAVGLVAGYAEHAEIEKIVLSGKLKFDSLKTIHIGGIAGCISGNETTVSNCNSSLFMNISPGNGSPAIRPNSNAYSYVGGFVGMFRKGAEIDNCHNTGNVAVDGMANAEDGQVFVGGIAGGSSLMYSTDYQGCITNSSSRGNVSGEAKGLWTFVGGIAGTIVGGNGLLETSTRIYRCYAKGGVSAAGTKSEFPHVGGIVAYNYYGAWVSQCWFDGEVTNGTADYTENDFTGGIAGYNSRMDGGHNSHIEDCWSAGTVQGYNNAGGIIGQNQVETLVRRCYSRAAVSVKNDADEIGAFASQAGIGGIAGYNASMEQDAISDCVALNASIRANAGTGIHRVVGRNSAGGRIANNYALHDIPVSTGGIYAPSKGPSALDGGDIGSLTQGFFQTTLGWDFITVWKWDGANGYPILRQNSTPFLKELQ
jgi:hypothetical protein